jgi:CBS domain-containing protein
MPDDLTFPYPMIASDIMTSPVITVGLDTPVSEIAALLAARRISAVPVVEDSRVVGLVSEADLLHRHEIGTDRTAPTDSGWRRWFSADRSAAEYTKSHAGRARDVMTREVISIAADARVEKIVALFEARGIKRVPVLRGEQLVGIVSRADLIRALATKGRAVNTAPAGNDATIRSRLIAELQRQPWWRSPPDNVLVSYGIVHYWGVIDSEDERDAARIAAENIPGVRGVEDHRVMTYAIPSMT